MKTTDVIDITTVFETKYWKKVKFVDNSHDSN